MAGCAAVILGGRGHVHGGLAMARHAQSGLGLSHCILTPGLGHFLLPPYDLSLPNDPNPNTLTTLNTIGQLSALRGDAVASLVIDTGEVEWYSSSATSSGWQSRVPSSCRV